VILILSIGVPFIAFVVVAKAKSDAKGVDAKDCENTVLSPFALEIPNVLDTESLNKAQLVFEPEPPVSVT
jgi:hypothetical protein